jgi:hypothetical protein
MLTLTVALTQNPLLSYQNPPQFAIDLTKPSFGATQEGNGPNYLSHDLLFFRFASRMLDLGRMTSLNVI